MHDPVKQQVHDRLLDRWVLEYTTYPGLYAASSGHIFEFDCEATAQQAAESSLMLVRVVKLGRNWEESKQWKE